MCPLNLNREYFEQIKDGLWRRHLEEKTTYDPIAILDALKSLRETDDAEPILFEGLCRGPRKCPETGGGYWSVRIEVEE